jgi:hypothetical protein
MAIVKGVNEIVHLPLYDSLFVRPGRQLKDLVSSNILKFFVNIHGKTKLETNMQAAALLPHWNTFEARALRVVISDLPEMCLSPVGSCSNGSNGNGNGHNDECTSLKDIELLFEECSHELKHEQVAAARESLNAVRYAVEEAKGISKDYEECLGLLRSFCDPVRMGKTLKLQDDLRSIRDELTTILTRTKVKVKKTDAVNRFLKELEELDAKGKEHYLLPKLDRAIECLSDFVKLTDLAGRIKGQNLAGIDACIAAAERLVTSAPARTDRSNGLKERLEAVARELEQCHAQRKHDRGRQILGKLLYNSVTTLFVGEKIMIQMPTWFFPAGAGPYSGNGQVVTNGFPTPQATFNFAEAVIIDTQQHFRVELEIPESDVFAELQHINGPFFIWVVLDGYMTRDVQ